MNTRSFLSTTALALATAITLNACSSDDSSDNNSTGGDPSSPSGGGNVESVTIGAQVWMKKNLNVDVAGSKCYNDDPANCAKYGRLYDWATAMALDSECSVTDCSSQVGAKHKGICPSGWHIPSKAEFDALIAYIDNDKGLTEVCNDEGYNCATPHAKYLKAISGWDDNGNGLDSYGFAALPSGVFGNGDFLGAGTYFYIWGSESNTSKGQAFRMRSNYDYSDPEDPVKILLLSVRCIKD